MRTAHGTIWRSLLCLFVLARMAAGGGPTNKTTPGELVIDPPTLINLGFEWLIEGDDNRNAKVEVEYRRTGDAQWKQGLPLLRLQGERIFQSEGVFDVISPNMFAGSILDLEPDTAASVRYAPTVVRNQPGMDFSFPPECCATSPERAPSVASTVAAQNSIAAEVIRGLATFRHKIQFSSGHS